MAGDAVRGSSLRALARAAGADWLDDDVTVTGVCADSRRARAGDVFVALSGTRRDGAAFAADAVAAGAVAVCVERRAGAGQAIAAQLVVPVIEVDDTHVALARMAAELEGDPGRRLRLIGVTGTLGKTSTALLVQAALAASPAGASHGVGVVGSLGARVRGPAADRLPPEALPSLGGMTTPDAPVLQRALRVMADAGIQTVAMEVTSHALAQRRVEGLAFALGLMTNLVPDEHLEYHPTPDDYLRTKARFFAHLAPGAPLVINGDDARVQAMVAAELARVARPLVTVSLGGAGGGTPHESPDVCVDALRQDAGGATFVLDVRRALPLLDGGALAPQQIPVVLPVLGVQQIANAALAVTAALIAGATVGGVTEALAAVEPMRRRMEVVRAAAPLVLDDTAGNPETLHAVFASVGSLPRRTLRVAFGVRGLRGPVINQRLAAALAELVAAHRATGAVELVVTASEETADARNRVQSQERDAVLDTLGDAGVPFRYEPRLSAAIDALLDGVHADDVVLLLGAQGMDPAAALLRERLARASAANAG
jgi:UDP-N-acetylmuramoyl-L-alanyl-D-glutamate--2,6-diaminopimelate ligase